MKEDLSYLLKRIEIYEIDKDVDRDYNEYLLKPVIDKEELDFLASSVGIKKTFKGETFYHVSMDVILGTKTIF